MTKRLLAAVLLLTLLTGCAPAPAPRDDRPLIAATVGRSSAGAAGGAWQDVRVRASKRAAASRLKVRLVIGRPPGRSFCTGRR